MKLKTMMLIKAVVCLVFGALLLFIPKTVYSLFGATLGAAGVFAAREYAASLFGNMLLTWYARDAGPSVARRAIVLALFVYDAVGVVVSVIAVLSGVMNALGWAIVLLYLFLTLGFGYFWFTEKPE